MSETPTQPHDTDLPEQMRVRREKRERLLAAGKQAYPVAVARTHTLEQVREQWGHLETGEETQDVVGVAGRVVFIRNTGKLCFATLQEGAGTRLQVMLSLAEVGEEALADWKAHVDLGDHVFVEGRVISSQARRAVGHGRATGRWRPRRCGPLPVLHKELSEEARVRQRYADLVVRQEARDMVRTRAAVAARHPPDPRGRQGTSRSRRPCCSWSTAAPRPGRSSTHINAFDQEMILRIALELNLKKAVVGGVDRVYEMGRIFRNEGVDSTHSPEFTMLEAYEAYGDQHTIGRADARHATSPSPMPLGSRQVETPDGHGRPRRRVALAAASTTGVSEAVGETVTLETDRETLLGSSRSATASRSTRRWRSRQGRSSSCSASWSSPTCCSRPSSATTPPSPSRWPGRTATTPASSRPGTSSSPASSAARPSPSSSTR